MTRGGASHRITGPSRTHADTKGTGIYRTARRELMFRGVQGVPSGCGPAGERGHSVTGPLLASMPLHSVPNSGPRNVVHSA